MLIKISAVSFMLAAFLALASVSAQADDAKTDIVQLENGNSVTGEIKSLEFGALTFSTDSMGTVTIDWDDVLGAISSQSLQVELIDGVRYFGELSKGDGKRDIHIRTVNGEVAFSTNEIVRMTPIDAEESFFEQLYGTVALGFQAQKANNVYTSNFSADVNYRARKYLLGMRLSSTMTNSDNADASTNQSFDMSYQKFRPNRWFSEWFAGWERNDELGVQSRTSAGGAWGRYLIQTNRNMISAAAGVQAVSQTYTGEDPSGRDFEGRLEVRYLHRVPDKSTSINFTSQMFPLLKDLSQYRSETDLNLNWEFLSDLSLIIGFGYSYTTDPPTGAASSDYSVTTSLGYSF